ncbi:NC domain protein, partial [Biomphalaria glabrata]
NNEIIHFKHNGFVFVVERSNLNTEANTGPPQICNGLDFNFTPLPTVDIVNKACSYLGREDYSLLFFNCEHLSNICRYGKKICEQ